VLIKLVVIVDDDSYLFNQKFYIFILLALVLTRKVYFGTNLDLVSCSFKKRWYNLLKLKLDFVTRA